MGGEGRVQTGAPFPWGRGGSPPGLEDTPANAGEGGAVRLCGWAAKGLGWPRAESRTQMQEAEPRGGWGRVRLQGQEEQGPSLAPRPQADLGLWGNSVQRRCWCR